jgi:hypothetical protein
VNFEVNWLNVAGISLDICGAVWLAKALAFARSTDLIDQSRTGYGSPAIVATLEHQRLDTRCGLALLIVGFGMQLISALLLNVPWSPWWIAACMAIVLSGTYVYYVRTKRLEDASRQSRIGKYLITGSEK